MSTDGRTLDPDVRDELAAAYIDLQETCEAQGLIAPRPGSLLSRHRHLLEILGAIHLGLVTSALCILVNFLVVNFMLHLPPF